MTDAMVIDVTSLAREVRRQDVSATLSSFAVVVAFLLVVTNLADIFAGFLALMRFDAELARNGWTLAAVAATAAAALLGPFGFIVLDWMVRQPWQHVSALLAAGFGAVALMGPGLALGGLAALVVEEELLSPRWRAGLVAGLLMMLALVLGWMMSPPGRRRRILLVLLALPFAAAFTALACITLVEAWHDDGALLDAVLAIVGPTLGLVALYWWTVHMAATQLVLAGNRPRELLVGALRGRSLWRRLAFLAGLPSSLWHRRAVTRPAFWAFLAARPLVYFGAVQLLGAVNNAGAIPIARINASLQPLGAFLRPLLLGLVLVIAGHLLFQLGKRLATRQIWNPDDPLDRRPPVLFLRSFEDDQFRFPRPWWDLAGRWVDLWSYRRNADEAMVDEIAQYGPVVALGMPGEQTVPFGAKRYYATHDDWQEIITRTARRARAIVIAAGDTPGVHWEYELLRREGLLSRTLLLVPPSQAVPAGVDEAATPSALPPALAAFEARTHVRLPPGTAAAGGCPIAACAARQADGHGQAGSAFSLITAGRPAAAAYVLAIRAFFQGTPPAMLRSSLSLDS